jgi:hypothetical protein
MKNSNSPDPSRTLRQSLSPNLLVDIRPAKEAAAQLRQHAGRFESYYFLEAIYRVYMDWKRRKIAKRSARALADEMNIVRRKGMSPIRILVEAALSGADLKQKSRWVRALEYVSSKQVSPKHFRTFVSRNGGLAGCASLAAERNRKRRRPGGDWND